MQLVRNFEPAREDFGDLVLFDGASREAVEGCLSRAPVMSAAPGETVLQAERPNSTVFILLRGTLRVDLAEGSGGFVHVGRGESVGELSVLDGYATSATVRAVDECELLALDGAAIRQLTDRSHAVASNLLRLLSHRLRAANRIVRDRVVESEGLRMRAVTDALTGLYNRRWLEDTVSRLAGRADHDSAHPTTFAVIMLDVDHFKRVNDDRGHLVGDRVLQRVSEAVRNTLRPTDFAARYGGEEIVVILPGVGNEPTAVEVAERIRRAVASLRMPEGPAAFGVTICAGVAVRQPGEGWAGLLGRADAALYKAKSTGRNRVASSGSAEA